MPLTRDFKVPLRDYIDATIGFEDLAALTTRPYSPVS